MSDVVTVQGIGIHSGASSTVRLHRIDGPVVFRRGATTVRPVVRSVLDVPLATVLAEGDARVAVVEHLLAALHVMDVWSGLVIEVDTDEVPILDGSAAPWLDALQTLAPFSPAPAATPFVGTASHGASGTARLVPGYGRFLDVSIDFGHAAIGRQRWRGGFDRWGDLVKARTFGFAAQADALRSAGRALGAGTENAIVFADAGPLSPLRFADEPVRHKALDALGDLYLLGAPFAGSLVVDRGGHALHHALMRSAVRATVGATGPS